MVTIAAEERQCFHTLFGGNSCKQVRKLQIFLSRSFDTVYLWATSIVHHVHNVLGFSCALKTITHMTFVHP
jgi:hypothetical protein